MQHPVRPSGPLAFTPPHGSRVCVLCVSTAAGKLFHDFFGENLFRTDMGIERCNLGSMLDHTGPMGQAEKYQVKEDDGDDEDEEEEDDVEHD
jgi:arginine/lysine/ornithine decarboxylase